MSEKAEPTPEWANRRDAVAVTLSQAAPGETVTYEEIARLHAIEPREGAGKHMCYSAREKLRRDHGITFRPIPNVGFRRLLDHETVEDEIRDRRTRGQARRHLQELDGVDRDRLDEQDRSKLDRKSIKANIMLALSRQGKGKAIDAGPQFRGLTGDQIIEGIQKAAK